MLTHTWNSCSRNNIVHYPIIARTTYLKVSGENTLFVQVQLLLKAAHQFNNFPGFLFKNINNIAHQVSNSYLHPCDTAFFLQI